MEIARAAAGLFVRQGLRATRAEDIARAAGIAPRTFYRYFAGKEEAVAPLYAAGAQRWAEAVREAPAGLSVPEALEHAVRHTLSPGAGVSAASWEWVRTLIRLATTSPALRKVWAEVCQEAEGTLAEVLAARTTTATAAATAADPTPSADNVAEHTPDGLAGTAAPHAADTAAAAHAADAAAPSPSPGAPAPRFAAAVASAAVRVAVENWAAGDAPPTGPAGPAALALRNLAALRDFPWEGRHAP
ncbi:TetR family transcriptional regulator [Streptomyces sp. JB150]|uniref:TetR/AcrR family transcriptional regulator n=1 Tax=Streptomyces sp. JB150 TaxID=2714844 RepID=UPI00140993C3|nr:TetR family transcriptional regulator [Streptomyces sp. JB150]QIJ66583.1 TetR family transcriptional regulator [Streptomyces sp. JB150]